MAESNYDHITGSEGLFQMSFVLLVDDGLRPSLSMGTYHEYVVAIPRKTTTQTTSLSDTLTRF